MSRHEDDLMAKLHDGSATVGDLIGHAEEVIVAHPEAHGTAVTEPVRLLLALIDVLTDADEHESVHQNDKLSEVFEG